MNAPRRQLSVRDPVIFFLPISPPLGSGPFSMHKMIVACGFGLFAAVLPVTAEVLTLPAANPAAGTTADLPARGEAQAKVLKRYGEPTLRHAAVGGSSPAQPRITRWDYAGASGSFSVFFENDHVVDAVVPDRPAPLFNTNELSAGG